MSWSQVRIIVNKKIKLNLEVKRMMVHSVLWLLLSQTFQYEVLSTAQYRKTAIRYYDLNKTNVLFIASFFVYLIDLTLMI